MYNPAPAYHPLSLHLIYRSEELGGAPLQFLSYFVDTTNTKKLAAAGAGAHFAQR